MCQGLLLRNLLEQLVEGLVVLDEALRRSEQQKIRVWWELTVLTQKPKANVAANDLSSKVLTFYRLPLTVDICYLYECFCGFLNSVFCLQCVLSGTEWCCRCRAPEPTTLVCLSFLVSRCWQVIGWSQEEDLSTLFSSRLPTGHVQQLDCVLELCVSFQ